MIELCISLPEPAEARAYSTTLLRRIQSSAVSNFSLHNYVKHFNSRKERGFILPLRNHWKSEATPLKEFFNHIEIQDRCTLLTRIRTQSSELPDGWIKSFVIPFCQGMATFIDTSCPEAQQCIRTLIDLYIRRLVGQEPKKPIDWARPQEVAVDKLPSVQCGCVQKINAFLLDTKTGSLDISCRTTYLSCAFNYFNYFGTRRSKDGVTTITKTLEWWKTKHATWEKCASDALAAVRKLPEAVLEKCLADQYDTILSLRALLADRDIVSLESTGTGVQTRSMAGKKRLHAEVSSSSEPSDDELALDYKLMGCQPPGRAVEASDGTR